MIFGYVSGLSPKGGQGPEYPQLCVVADKPATYSVPVKVETLMETESAIHLVSNVEGLLVERGESQRSVVISPVLPSKLYLTLNLPERPGFAVEKLEIVAIGEGRHRVRFDRGRGWEPWQPNIKLY